MGKKSYYVFRNGTLKRKDNTLFFYWEEKGESQKRVIPIASVEDIFIFGEVSFNTKVMVFLSQNQVPMHIFNYYGYYSGSFYPREQSVSGLLVCRQVLQWTDENKRILLVQKLLEGVVHNILKNLKYYENRIGGLAEKIQQIAGIQEQIVGAKSVEELRGLEGKIRKIYYEGWNSILRKGDPVFAFTKREKKPPTNPINALISFGNSLLYAVVLSEVYHTPLHPAISFFHEVGTRRFSLCLDIAEVFKPILVDRLIFDLVNHRKLQKKHFSEELNLCYLEEKGRKIFIEAFDRKMSTTIRHPKLRRKVSYRRLIRLECYKLVKHLLGEQTYEAFRSWW